MKLGSTVSPVLFGDIEYINNKLFWDFYVCEYLPECYVCACWGQKVATDPLTLELQMVVSLHMGGGNWILILSEEQTVILTAEPSFQTQEFNFVYFKDRCDS